MAPAEERALMGMLPYTVLTIIVTLMAVGKNVTLRLAHGAWLAEHFTKTAAKCQVNVGGTDRKGAPNQHGAQMASTVDGTFVRQLVSL